MTLPPSMINKPTLSDVTGTSMVDLVSNPLHGDWALTSPMPEWLTTFRSHQIVAMMQVIDAFTRTSTVILDAPVGSGKSVIADMVRRFLMDQSVYICTTKTLQNQFVTDFPHSRVLKGRANYPTANASFPSVTAGDCTKSGGLSCRFCDVVEQCPYTLAKRAALGAQTAVLNTAYFLAEANYIGAFAGRGLVVADEADLLEGALMGWVEVEINKKWQGLLGVKPPKVKTEKAKSNDWQEWSVGALSAARGYATGLGPATSEIKFNKHRKAAWALVGKLELLVKELPEGGWVYDGYDRRKATVLFKPVKVDKLAEKALWEHGDRWLLMSGSVISPSEMADSLGVGNYEAVTVDTGWDNARRPIWVSPVANVVYKEKDTAYGVVAEAVVEIAERHQDQRILVHGVSYQLTKVIADRVGKALRGTGRRVFTYTNAFDREAALEGYIATPGSIIVAPSMDRGVDFKDDLARVQVVCKVPYPSMGDKQVAKRMHMGRAGDAWFKANTVRGFVQMIGRGMRHEGDWCVTYAIDAQLPSNIIKRSRALLPGWVRDSLQYGDRPWLEGMGIDMEIVNGDGGGEDDEDGEDGEMGEVFGKPAKDDPVPIGASGFDWMEI